LSFAVASLSCRPPGVSASCASSPSLRSRSNRCHTPTRRVRSAGRLRSDWMKEIARCHAEIRYDAGGCYSLARVRVHKHSMCLLCHLTSKRKGHVRQQGLRALQGRRFRRHELLNVVQEDLGHCSRCALLSRQIARLPEDDRRRDAGRAVEVYLRKRRAAVVSGLFRAERGRELEDFVHREDELLLRRTRHALWRQQLEHGRLDRVSHGVRFPGEGTGPRNSGVCRGAVLQRKSQNCGHRTRLKVLHRGDASQERRTRGGGAPAGLSSPSTRLKGRAQ